MGLAKTICFAAAFSFALVHAQPRLRLSSTTIGPVTVAVGGNPGAQSVEASNAGTGILNLQATSSVAWIRPTVSAPHICSVFGGSNCISIDMAFNANALTAGSYTGIVTVADPNAIDAPQTITVTIAVGGTIPNSVDLFVAPNGSQDSFRLSTNKLLTSTVSAQGGNWLSFGFTGASSFAFALPYTLIAKHQPGMAEGNYTGSLALSGSDLAADNKNVAVNLRVTSQPIIQLSSSLLRVSSSPGSSKRLFRFTYANRGVGTLSLGAVTATGGSWLAVTAFPQFNIFDVTIDSSTLAPGSYNGNITVASNAINGTQTVPVALDVFPQSPPVSGRVANNATFSSDEEIAQGTIVALFGEQLTYADPTSATALPLPQTLGGARVLVNGVPAPVYYTQFDQINFQVPYDAALGLGTVRVERNGQVGNPISIRVSARAPKLLRLGIGEYGILVNQDGSFPIPTTPGINSRPARVGEVLTMYALGLGTTVPSVVSGAASPSLPLANVTTPSTVTFGVGAVGGSADPVRPQFIGLSPGFVGLYQINVAVPANSPKGNRIGIELNFGPTITSNRVEIAVQ